MLRETVLWSFSGCFIRETEGRVTCLGKQSNEVVGIFDNQIEVVRVMSDEDQESNGALNYTMIMLYKQM